MNVLARLDLARFVGKFAVMLQPPLRVIEILVETLLRVVRRGRDDFGVGVNAAQALRRFPRDTLPPAFGD
jgi:hypothetical protein